MKAAVLGFVAVTGLVVLGAGAPPERTAAPVSSGVPQAAAAANSDLLVVSATLGDRLQQVTVIDSKQRVMSVYQIDAQTGRIALRSVRKIHWDLQMTEYNGESPLPREIQALLERN